MRMKREPLTSTDAAAGASPSAATSASTLAKARAPANAATVFALSAPAAQSVSMPRSLRVGADLAVERRPLVADLAHVAEDEPARRRQRGEDVDRGAHRIGIGVVGVVDQRHGDAAARRCAWPASGRERRRSLPARARRHRAALPAASAAALAASALRTLCAPATRSAKVAGAGGRLHRHRPVVALPRRRARDVGRRVEREAQRRAACRRARARSARARRRPGRRRCRRRRARRSRRRSRAPRRRRCS